MERITSFMGRLIGYLDDRGYEIVCKDSMGRILARYDKAENVTRDFSGKIVARGNVAVAFLGDPRTW